MSQQPVLSIGDFALMTEIPARTLRYYHHQGLLVPAQVGESGYRGYSFEQTHQALLIMALRRAGVSIRQIRDVLHTPDLLPEVLTKYQTELERERNRQDNAMADAWRLAGGWPQADVRNKPASAAVIRQVPGEVVAPGEGMVPQRIRTEAAVLRRELVEAGVETQGAPWCQYALRTPEDKMKAQSTQGPDWLVAVELRGSGEAPLTLPVNTTLLNLAGGQELVVHLPAVPTLAAYSAATEYLLKTALERGMVPNFDQSRYTLDDDHFEIVLAVNPRGSMQ